MNRELLAHSLLIFSATKTRPLDQRNTLLERKREGKTTVRSVTSGPDSRAQAFIATGLAHFLNKSPGPQICLSRFVRYCACIFEGVHKLASDPCLNVLVNERCSLG